MTGACLFKHCLILSKLVHHCINVVVVYFLALICPWYITGDLSASFVRFSADCEVGGGHEDLCGHWHDHRHLHQHDVPRHCLRPSLLCGKRVV